MQHVPPLEKDKHQKNHCVFDMEQFARGYIERRTESLSLIWQVFGGRGSPLAGNRQNPPGLVNSSHKPTFKKRNIIFPTTKPSGFPAQRERNNINPKPTNTYPFKASHRRTDKLLVKNWRPATTRHEA